MKTSLVVAIGAGVLGLGGLVWWLKRQNDKPRAETITTASGAVFPIETPMNKEKMANSAEAGVAAVQKANTVVKAIAAYEKAWLESRPAENPANFNSVRRDVSIRAQKVKDEALAAGQTAEAAEAAAAAFVKDFGMKALAGFAKTKRQEAATALATQAYRERMKNDPAFKLETQRKMCAGLDPKTRATLPVCKQFETGGSVNGVAGLGMHRGQDSTSMYRGGGYAGGGLLGMRG